MGTTEGEGGTGVAVGNAADGDGEGEVDGSRPAVMIPWPADGTGVPSGTACPAQIPVSRRLSGADR